MMALIQRAGFGRSIGWQIPKEIAMKWETPVAVELRFGMEITMYVSNR